MDKEQKKAELSIRNNFIKWLSLQGLDSAIYVMGYKIIGKTTMCHLLKKVADSFNDPNLKFVERKKQYVFEYENQINFKISKPLTIYPKLYKIQTTNTNIIEVPPKFYSPQPKRQNIDKLITLVGLSYTAQKGKFLFFVDSGKTSGKLQTWKKSFSTVLDAFQNTFFQQKSLNSMAFVFTKAKESAQAYINRIPDLKTYIEKENDPHREFYQKIAESIMENKRAGVSTKFSSDNQSDKVAQSDAKAIIEIYQNLQEANMVKFIDGKETHMLKIRPVQLSKDQMELYNKFLDPLEQILNFLTQFYEMIFASQTNADLKEFMNFLDSKSGRIKKIIDAALTDCDKQDQEINVLNQKYNQLVEISARTNFYKSAMGMGKCLFFVNFKQTIIQKQNNGFKSIQDLLSVLAQNGFFIKQIEEVLKPLYMELIIFSLFEQRYGPHIVNFDIKKLLRSQAIRKIFSEESEIKLKDVFLNSDFTSSSSQNKKFIEETLDRLFSLSDSDSLVMEKVENIKKKLTSFQIDVRFPEKGIPKVYEQLENLINVQKKLDKIVGGQYDEQHKDIANMNNLLGLLAIMLEKIGHDELSLQIFIDSGDYGKAKQILQKKLKSFKGKEEQEPLENVEPVVLSYVDLLIEMRLLENALNTCYEYASTYKELRPKLLEKMKIARQKYAQQFSQDFEERFLTGNSPKLFSFYQDKQLFRKVGQIAAKLKQQTAE